MKDNCVPYSFSFDEAKRNNEVDAWKSSYRTNVACKEAIEAVIRSSFDGMHLKDDCAKTVIDDFGFARVNYVLANTVQQKEWDGRFSDANKKWSNAIYVPPDKNFNHNFVVESHPAVLDGFINQARKAYNLLGLFSNNHCEPDSSHMNFENKVLVLNPDNLRENSLISQNQLWLALDGYGCSPDAAGHSIRSVCIFDGERIRLNRSDFLGVLKDEHLPDWAFEKLNEIREQEGMNISKAQEGMTMQ